MFLPVNRKEMDERGWEQADFILVSGDAYVDHPSFGVAIVSRVLEAFSYKVAILAQPDIKNPEAFKVFGKPRLAFLVTAGNIDSMVNHYTSSKRRREVDHYTPGGKMRKRPDKATIAYGKAIRQTYPDASIIIGGIESSLRRLAHYDYVSNSFRQSILLEANADLLVYGMAEKTIVDIAEYLDSGMKPTDLDFLRGTVWKTNDERRISKGAVMLPSYESMLKDKTEYARSFKTQYANNDAYSAKILVEKYSSGFVVQNQPAEPLSREYLDWVYSLPYERTAHPMYEEGVLAIEEVQHSIISNRGCFGACSFCALSQHQGRIIQSRSKESIVEEAKRIIADPSFKGYIHDVGGPTANFHLPSCSKQEKSGACIGKECLHPTKCAQLRVTHEEYLDILRTLRKMENVKKVFVRSGIRYDYLMYDKDDTFFRELVQHHISGQLKVAPEHVSDNVLSYMQKPSVALYDRFVEKYKTLNEAYGKNQFLVPYLMSGHPGSTLRDAIELALYIKKHHLKIEQVQDFYPTPSTLATCMYYTKIDPRTMKPVYVADTMEEKAMQRALMQFQNPKNHRIVKDALLKAGRGDLIGTGPNCLIPPTMLVKNQAVRKFSKKPL